MKRLFLLPVLLLLVFHCNLTFAAEKWFLLYQDNEVRSFLDTENFECVNAGVAITYDCWIKTEGYGGTELVHMKVADYGDTIEFLITEVSVYDKNGNYKGGEKPSNPEWQKPDPGSSTEKLINKVIDWEAPKKLCK